jgi:hypothetical protein
VNCVHRISSPYQGENIIVSDIDRPRDDLPTNDSELSTEPPINPNAPQTPLSTLPIFFPHPDERILSCGLKVVRFGQVVHNFEVVFYVNIQVFLSSSYESTEVSWEKWGPQSTRWFWGASTDWRPHALWGYRAVDIFGDYQFDEAGNLIDSGPRKVKVRVTRRDFNPCVVKKALLPSEVRDEL